MSGKVDKNTLAPGMTLRQYKIIQVIGQGGFGITYLAVDTDLDRKVAIKECFPRDFVSRDGTTIVPTSANDKKDFDWALGKFVDEATTLARFKHPGIVQVLQIIKGENNSAYMVLEYVEGQSLDAWLRSLGRVPTEVELLGVSRPILEALAVVHKSGITHRDIAPDNIFIRPNGQAVLLDFGAAKSTLGQHSRTLNLVVKDGYSAPEQYYAEGRQGPWTDIYSFAATLYRALAGKKPADAMARLDAINNGENDPLHALGTLGLKGFSKPVLNAIALGLMPQIKDRPRSIDDWASILFGKSEQPEKGDGKEKPKAKKQLKAKSQEARKSVFLPAILLSLLVMSMGGIAYYWFVVRQGELAVEAWKQALSTDTLQAYQSFLQSYPTSEYRGEAERALIGLEAPWQVQLGNGNKGAAKGVVATSDGIFVVGQETVQASGDQQAVIYKLSQSGKTTWIQRAGPRGADVFEGVISLKDGGALAIGQTVAGSSQSVDAVAYRYSNDGALLWEKAFGGPGSDRFSAGKEMSDGTIVAVGATSAAVDAKTDGWLVEIDQMGTIKSSKTFGGSENDYFKSVSNDENGTLVLVGTADVSDQDGGNFWVLKLAKDGSNLFERKAGGPASDNLLAAANLSPNEFVFAGDTASFGTNADGILLRLTSDNKLPPTIVANDQEDFLTSLDKTPQGNLIVGGYTNSKGAKDFDAWVMQYNSDLKSKNWERIFGGNGDQKIGAVTVLPDGSVIFAGGEYIAGKPEKGIWVGKILKDGSVSNEIN